MESTKQSNGPTIPESQRQSLEIWQQKTARVLHGEDLREITENLTGFFNALESFDKGSMTSAEPASQSLEIEGESK